MPKSNNKKKDDGDEEKKQTTEEEVDEYEGSNDPELVEAVLDEVFPEEDLGLGCDLDRLGLGLDNGIKESDYI